jgi:hypothetical protein
MGARSDPRAGRLVGGSRVRGAHGNVATMRLPVLYHTGARLSICGGAGTPPHHTHVMTWVTSCVVAPTGHEMCTVKSKANVTPVR